MKMKYIKPPFLLASMTENREKEKERLENIMKKKSEKNGLIIAVTAFVLIIAVSCIFAVHNRKTEKSDLIEDYKTVQSSEDYDYQELQKQVDNGHYQWRLDGREVARDYAISELKWQEFNVEEFGDNADGMFVTASDKDGYVWIYRLIQPAKKGTEGIWTVKSAEPLTNEATLYFTDEEAMYLIPEKRKITVNKNEILEFQVCSEIIKGPENKELKSTVTKDVGVRSVTVGNGLCTVDLSEEFAKNNTGGSAKESKAIYSIVNSLCTLDTVDSVKFLIEGKENPEFGGHFDMSEHFEFSDSELKK